MKYVFGKTQSLCLLLLLIVIASGFVSGQSVLNKELIINGARANVKCLQKRGTDYISLGDFAKAAGIPYKFSPSSKAGELKAGEGTLKFYANNSFFIQINKTGKNSEVRQLPVTTILQQNDIFIPVGYCLPILAQVSGKKITDSGKKPAAIAAETQTPATPSEERPESSPVISNANLQLKITQMSNGTMVSFKVNTKLKKFISTYDDGVITISLKGIAASSKPLQYTAAKGVVREVTSREGKGGTDIKVLVSSDYTTHELIQENDKELLLTIHNKKFAHSETTNPNKEKWKFDVIVLDAGHGGQDYGAIGYNGTVEKNINLAVVLKLGELIEQNMKDVKVIYTRHDDTFIELYKRGKIANENNGKLFISVHCNSVESKSSAPNGYEIYLLRPGRTQEAIRIAERENGVISYEDDPNRYKKLTDENFILVSMAHSSNMKYSEKFADLLNNHLKQTVSISSRGIKQAGFYVLVGASMPSILFETGYVTNEEDSRYLKSKEGVEEIASALLQAIKSFKLYYSEEIENN
jgi:N-acetylmuramoyl-L-alanine amidase